MVRMGPLMTPGSDKLLPLNIYLCLLRIEEQRIRSILKAHAVGAAFYKNRLVVASGVGLWKEIQYKEERQL